MKDAWGLLVVKDVLRSQSTIERMEQRVHPGTSSGATGQLSGGIGGKELSKRQAGL